MGNQMVLRFAVRLAETTFSFKSLSMVVMLTLLLSNSEKVHAWQTGKSRIDDILKPESTEDLWEVVEREIRYGNFKQAENYLDKLLAHPSLNDDAYKLQDRFGPGLLFQLQRIDNLRVKGKQLQDLINKAGMGRMKDVARIQKYIANLNKGPRFKEFAIDELRKSGPYAIVEIVNAFQKQTLDYKLCNEVLSRMDSSSWQSIAALAQSNQSDLVDFSINALAKFQVQESTEYLWHIYGSDRFAKDQRERVGKILANLMGKAVQELPRPEQALMDLADMHYRKQSTISPAEPNRNLWQWNNGNISLFSLTALEYETWMGLLAAKSAIEIDPKLDEAQILLISLAFESDTKKIGIDRQLPDKLSGILETALLAGPSLLEKTLERAIDDGRTAVVLQATRALGETGNISQFVQESTGEIVNSSALNSLVQQSLNYPNRRVRHEAAISVLEAHPDKTFPGSEDILNILASSIDNNLQSTAVIVHSDATIANQLSSMFQEIGYQTKVTFTGKNGFKEAVQSSGVDLIVIGSAVKDWDLEGTVSNFKADNRTASVPMIVLSQDPMQGKVDSLQRRYSKILAMPYYAESDAYKSAIELKLSDPTDMPLSDEEKLKYREEAMNWSVRVARGEFDHLKVDSLLDPLSQMLANPDYCAQAAEAISHVHTPKAQSYLADVIMNTSVPVDVRMTCSNALSRNIQRSGQSLSNETLTQFEKMYQNENDLPFRRALARLSGTLRPRSEVVAERITQYRPLTDNDISGDSAPKNSTGTETPKKNSEEEETEESESKAEDSKANKAGSGFFDDGI